MVGTSGSCGLRLAAATASGRILPFLIWPITEGMVSKLTCTWPPIRSISAGLLPRYGMWVMKVPVASLNSSAAMCWVLPEPLLA